MKKQVIDDIKSVFKEVRQALIDGDANRIQALSNHTIHNASIYQDSLSLTTAVSVYALAKVVTRCHSQSHVCLELRKLVDETLKACRDDGSLKRALKQLIKSLSQFDKQYKMYVQEVVTKARINKGSALYKHGISIGRAAAMLKVSRWDLQDYVGKTKLVGQENEKFNVKKKYAVVKEIFK